MNRPQGRQIYTINTISGCFTHTHIRLSCHKWINEIKENPVLINFNRILFRLISFISINLLSRFADYLGVHFASFLLEIVEGNNPELLVDMVIALILAFNQQFSEQSVNVIIEAMQNLPTAKVFTEKLLLLLNREGKFSLTINSAPSWHSYWKWEYHDIPEI